MLLTVIVNDFVSEAAPSLALADALYVPASENEGARWMFPVVAFVVVTVMNVGPEAFVNVRA